MTTTTIDHDDFLRIGLPVARNIFAQYRTNHTVAALLRAVHIAYSANLIDEEKHGSSFV